MVPTAAPGASVQLVAGVNDPAPVEEKAMVPVGSLTGPAFVSVTVATHEVETPDGRLVGEQATRSDVARVVTGSAEVNVLPA